MSKTDIRRRHFLGQLGGGSAALALSNGVARAITNATTPPNIVWITCEDIDPMFGCYGHTDINTPVVDGMAAEGVRFTNAYGTHGVCAPNRACIISGMYPTSVGANHMRCGAREPSWLKPLPVQLRENGYFCTNYYKEDYQGLTSGQVWDVSENNESTAHWRNPGRGRKPFFAVFNTLSTHEGSTCGVRSQPRDCPHYPPYYLQTPEASGVWENCHQMVENKLEPFVKKYLDQLEADGLAENTIVFFFSDHGFGIPRHKRSVYDTGLRVPFVVRVPSQFRAMAGMGTPGSVTDELISFVDLVPTMLNLCGAPIPDYLQGRAFMGPNLTPQREYIYAAHDRVDERYDIIRAVRNKRYKYIRNYEPWVNFMQYINYREGCILLRQLREGHENGTLPAIPESIMADRKPREQFYDCQNDPWEVNNIAGDPAHAQILAQMRQAHLDWAEQTGDLGYIPEAEVNSRANSLGSHWAVGHDDGGAALRKIRETSVLWERGADAIPDMITALSDSDSAVRYWGAMGLGNLCPGDTRDAVIGALRTALADPQAIVRIAAARSIAYLGDSSAGLPVLKPFVENSSHAAARLALNELDMMGALAAPLQADLQALVNRKGSDWKVASRAVGTIAASPLFPCDPDATAPRRGRTPVPFRSLDARVRAGWIDVRVPGKSCRKLQLVSPSGRVVKTVDVVHGQREYRLPTHTVASGVYTLRAMTGTMTSAVSLSLL